MVKDKYKFKRRRAIECKFVEKSKTSPGYLKYEITICEKDGTVHKKPAYGVDMQSAIARLVNQERTAVVEKKVTNNPLLFFIAWVILMAWPVLLTQTHNSPWFVLYMFGGIIGLFVIGAWWQNYLEKK